MNWLQPPRALCEPDEESDFEPIEGLWPWCRETLMHSGSRLYNADHDHLQQAVVGFLWTAVPNQDKGRNVAGTAQLGTPSGKPWPRGRLRQQLCEWFGGIPSFLITLYAPWFDQAGDAQRMAVLEHELMHCSYVKSACGECMYQSDGTTPQWYIRGHDVQEFIGIARRYGAVHPGLRELKAALDAEPLLPGVWIEAACGTCRRAA